MPGAMTLNDKVDEEWLWMPKGRKNGDSKCQNGYAQRLWMSKLKEDDGTKRQNWEEMVALNANLKVDGDSKGQNKNAVLNAKLKMWS